MGDVRDLKEHKFEGLGSGMEGVRKFYFNQSIKKPQVTTFFSNKNWNLFIFPSDLVVCCKQKSSFREIILC